MWDIFCKGCVRERVCVKTQGSCKEKKISRVARENLSREVKHVLSTWLHFAGSLLASYLQKFLWSSMSLKSSHSLLHTTLTMKSHINTGYIRLNKITIKFGTELKPIQNSCKLQLYKVYLSTLDKPKVTINYI